MRYIVGLGVALLVIGAVWIAQWRISVAVTREIRQQLRRDKDAGAPELANIDPDAFEFQDVGMELPANLKVRISVVDAIAGLWWIWIPVTILSCLAIAHLIPTRGKP